MKYLFHGVEVGYAIKFDGFYPTHIMWCCAFAFVSGRFEAIPDIGMKKGMLLISAQGRGTRTFV